MTSEQRKRFTVITNNEYGKKTEFRDKRNSYQTNPLTEKLMKFTNNEAGPKFSIQDLLR